MRHARAESFATDDHARRLTGRGRRDALEAGQWLAAHGLVPDRVLVSSAVRAVATWQAVAEGLGTPSATADSVEDALYGARAEDGLEALRAVPEEVDCVLYVGHNPTVFSLVHLLDDGNADPDAFRAMSVGYPPCAMTVFELDVPWAELGEGTGRVVAFHVGQATTP
jgi:phosphohistidine phosphatase